MCIIRSMVVDGFAASWYGPHFMNLYESFRLPASRGKTLLCKTEVQ